MLASETVLFLLSFGFRTLFFLDITYKCKALLIAFQTNTELIIDTKKRHFKWIYNNRTVQRASLESLRQYFAIRLWLCSIRKFEALCPEYGIAFGKSVCFYKF